MRIWIDASLVARGGGAGSKRYVSHLASGLAEAGEQVTVIAPKGVFPAPISPLRAPTRLAHAFWAFARWPPLTWLVNDPPPRLVHVPEAVSVPPTPKGIALAVTVHDLSCLGDPELCAARLRFLVKRAWRTRTSWDLVFTGTEAVKRELVDLGMSADRIWVTPWGVADEFAGPPVPSEELSDRLGPDRPTVVFVGPLSRKKGGDILLRALDRLRTTIASDVELAVRGPGSLDAVGRLVAPELLARVRPAIRFLPPLSDGDLAALYRQASVVACPSRVEGYNFPLVEALSTGAAVVATDIPVHREVSQGAAILVPPEDPEALAAGIETALAGRRLQVSYARPSWFETVRLTRRAYEAVTRE